MLYAYESIPSTLSSDQIATVLKTARRDQSPMGLRDYAILHLLSTYGLRAGEISHLRLDDIDWRAETLRIRHSKTGAHSLLPLMQPVGEALINYLRDGRPQTDAREIFIRSRAPYLQMSRIYSGVRRRMEAAGVKPSGKRALISSGMHAPLVCCAPRSLGKSLAMCWAIVRRNRRSPI
jgi:site-specific recombinase XerD